MRPQQWSRHGGGRTSLGVEPPDLVTPGPTISSMTGSDMTSQRKNMIHMGRFAKNMKSVSRPALETISSYANVSLGCLRDVVGGVFVVSVILMNCNPISTECPLAPGDKGAYKKSGGLSDSMRHHCTLSDTRYSVSASFHGKESILVVTHILNRADQNGVHVTSS